MPPQQSDSTFPLPAQKNRKNLGVILALVSLLIAALIFGVWAFQGRQSYKNDSDKKVATAVAQAQAAAAAKQKAADDQAAKAPYKTYSSSATNGSITFSYPKTWSAYIDETSNDTPINGYFYPNQVPGVSSSTAFALRVQLVSTAYSDVLNNFQSLIGQGTVTAAAYTPPKMKGVANVQVGTRLDGAVAPDNANFKGAMVVIKIRDKTLEIYTESNDFMSDFNNIILPSFNFSP